VKPRLARPINLVEQEAKLVGFTAQRSRLRLYLLASFDCPPLRSIPIAPSVQVVTLSLPVAPHLPQQRPNLPSLLDRIPAEQAVLARVPVCSWRAGSPCAAMRQRVLPCTAGARQDPPDARSLRRRAADAGSWSDTITFACRMTFADDGVAAALRLHVLNGDKSDRPAIGKRGLLLRSDAMPLGLASAAYRG
jgi:hypothetical protein